MTVDRRQFVFTVLVIVLGLSHLTNCQAVAIDLTDGPVLKYGTAWKNEKTADLVYKAIKSGFRHIDTACQPRHYREDLVGEGWTRAANELDLSRSEIHLQTKFSGAKAHEPGTEPYDVNAPLEERVRQSLKKSLENLQTSYLDSWIMHGPEDSWDNTWKVYNTMEEAVDAGTVKQIGISNFYQLEDVQWLYEHARIKPRVLQNRFYPETNHDAELRSFCKAHGIEYQSFWTLTANEHAWRSPPALEIAQKRGVSPEALFYAFCMAIGISPLDGTTNEEHMREDMELMDRIRGGKKFFRNKTELQTIILILGFTHEFDRSTLLHTEEYAEEEL